MLYLALAIVLIVVVAVVALVPFFLLLYLGETVLASASLGTQARFLLIMLKGLHRNLLRTSLTYLAVFVLVIVVVLVWSMLLYLDGLMTEKTSDIKVIVTEKWRVDSHLPFAYAGPLSDGAANPSHAEDVRPLDSMTWQIYVGTLDKEKNTRENLVFFIALEPHKILTMMNDLLNEISPKQANNKQELSPEEVESLQKIIRAMQSNKWAVVVGCNRLKAIGKRVGDRFSLSGLNYKDIDMEFEIVGTLPEGGRFNETAFMNRDYFNDKLDGYARDHAGTRHPQAGKSLDMVWLKVADLENYGHVARQIDSSGLFTDPMVKSETLSSAVAAVMEIYRDITWGMRWWLSPAVLITMSLVVANAISLGVRERRTELAVLKVLGFRPWQILTLVLGEALLIGAVSGVLSAALTYFFFNIVLANISWIPLSIPPSALWWGLALGGLTAFAGSLFPAVTACRVRVAEVFARVT